MPRGGWNKGLKNPMGRTPAERFWEKVERRGHDECWPWLGSKDRWGRGYFSFRGKTERAPRVAWSLSYGEPFPADKDACHTCDNPTCVNPRHIWIGDARENLRDAVRKGRHRSSNQYMKGATPT